MKRADLEHLIRAAAAITNEHELVIVGSQSILGAFPDAPEELLVSQEADIYPLAFDARKSDLIDGSIGEGSPFADLFGYYAQGVGPETAVLPRGWEQRLVKVQSANTDLKIGLCLEPHDLAVSKLAAAREKDGEFVRAMLRHGLVQRDTLHARIGALEVGKDRKQRIGAALDRMLPGLAAEEPRSDDDESADQPPPAPPG